MKTPPDTTPAGARALYERMYADPAYRMAAHLRTTIEPLLKKEVERVIAQTPYEQDPLAWCCDVACGRGEMVDFINALPGAECIGFEIVPSLAKDGAEGVEIIETMLDIPSGEHEHDVVSCLDALEHLAEVDILAAITELWRITHDTLIIAVGCTPSTFSPTVELHPTQKQPGWWRDRIREATSTEPENAYEKTGRVARVHGKQIINYDAATFVVRRAGGDG
jgi:hypothetical protein